MFYFIGMKRIIISIFMMAVACFSASAQNEQGGFNRPNMDSAEWAKRRTERMVQKYGLNEQQAAALQALNEKMPRRNGRRPESKDSVDAQRPNGQRGPRMGGEFMKQYNEKLQKIMTADQFKAYMEDMEKRQQERRNRPHRPQR